MFYATFDGFHNEDGEGKIRWTNVRDEVGNYMKGFFLSEKKPLFKKYKARRGNRYLIFTSKIECREFLDIYRVKKVNKNPKCDIFRKANNKYYIVRGKYKGKTSEDIDDGDLATYCIWLARRTTNETTIKNALNILKEIHEK
tara:strand:+ start:1875 stop:2300 length:426 start_codon:yes stop_codon:yes gene_type:complete